MYFTNWRAKEKKRVCAKCNTFSQKQKWRDGWTWQKNVKKKYIYLADSMCRFLHCLSQPMLLSWTWNWKTTFPGCQRLRLPHCKLLKGWSIQDFHWAMARPLRERRWLIYVLIYYVFYEFHWLNFRSIWLEPLFLFVFCVLQKHKKQSLRPPTGYLSCTFTYCYSSE